MIPAAYARRGGDSLAWRPALAAGTVPGRRAAAGVRARVVVAGAGFAGSSCALHLRSLDPNLDVTVVDPDEYFATGPMSNEVVVGLRTLASITVSRDGLRRAGIRFVRDRVAGIDAPDGRVHLAGGGALRFDRLVVAPGIRFLSNRPEGYDAAAMLRMPHAWIAGEQTRRLARLLHEMPDGGVVAISVPSGLRRCPPAPYERASLIADYLRRRKPRSKLLIFDSNNQFPKQDLFAESWRTLYPGLIEWIAPTDDGAVLRVDAPAMTLYTAGGAHRVAVASVIPQQAPGMLALDAGLAASHGWCPVDPRTFESLLVARVHVIGDACIADAMPKSASAAQSQAAQCAAAIAAALSARESASEAAFTSVCYSFVAPDRAVAIRGRYAVRDGRIDALDSTAPQDSTAPKDSAARPSEFDGAQAREAAQWYEEALAGTFAAAPHRD